MIGASALSDAAAGLEAAANAGDGAAVRAGHAAMMESYAAAAAAIRAMLPETETSDGDGDDVLEFLPED